LDEQRLKKHAKEEECPSEQKASLCGCEKARNRWFSAVDRQTKIRTKENSKEDLKEDDRCQSLFTGSSNK
jgi:hypothetical protein